MTFDTERRYYVYVWYIKDTNEVFYIGKGTGNRYKVRKRENEYFMKMLNSHECESKIIIDNLDEETAFRCEELAIAIYRLTDCRLTNVTDGGENPPKTYGKRPEWWIENQRKGIIKSNREHPERSHRQSERMKKFLNTKEGKSFQMKSIKTRQSDEFRKKLSVVCTRANRTPEYRQRMSEYWKNYFKENGAYESHFGASNVNAQKVNQYDLSGNLINEYDTMTNASKATGVSVSKISAVCRGKRKTAGGYIWRFATDKRVTFNRKHKPEPNPNLEKPILQLTKDGTLVNEYRSVASACRDGGFKNRSNIICALKGRTKTAYGYVWKYK